jgi:multidrug efflux system membrane fusion protein
MPRQRTPHTVIRASGSRVVDADFDDDDDSAPTVVAMMTPWGQPIVPSPSSVKRTALSVEVRAHVVHQSLLKPRHRLLLRAGFGAFAVAIVCTIVMRLIGGGGTVAPAASDPLVRTAFAQERQAAQLVHTTGLVATGRELTLSFKVGGIVRSVHVKDGDAVRNGAVLAAIDRSEVAAQSRAARDVVNKAQRDYERVKTLHDQNALSLQVVQDARSQRDQALSGLRVAELNEHYATITAPCDGLVTKRHREANEAVAPGAPVIDFACTTEGWLAKASVPDRDRLRIHIGDAAQVRFGAYGSRTFAGTVTGVAAKASAVTGAFEIEVELAGTDADFYSGMVAKVDIEPRSEGKLISIPMEALVEGNGSQGHVFVLDRDRVHVHKVTVDVAFIDDPNVVLSAGLAPSAEVITDGATYLSDGAKVKLAKNHIANL